MELVDYLENNKGIGILATSDKDGNVDAAIYAHPHFMEDGTIAFIMADKLTHKNIRSNPHAIYMFIQEGPGYKGKRLHLTMVKEESDMEQIKAVRRRHVPVEDDGESNKFLVYFKISKVRPLVGG